MYKVMIVDDMEIVRMEIKRLKLWGEKSGFVITQEAKNGQEALIKLKKCKVDLVITDIKMPIIDGIELLRTIMENNLCSCVIFLSDYSEFSYARQGIVLGAFDYLSKQVNEDEFISVLQRANKFITNKRREIDRVRKLEKTLEEKNEVSFRSDDATQVIELIQNRDTNTLKTMSKMIDRVGSSLNYELIRVESVFKNGILEVINHLLEKNSWLEKFIDTEAFKKFNFSECNDFEDIKDLLIEKINTLITILDKLQYGYHDKGIVWQVCNCVLENVDNELSLKIVAEKLFMNRTYISEAFKQKTGMSFVEYLTIVKMERAKVLIAEDGLRVYELAEKIGFSDAEYFSKLFKKYSGMSPTEFRSIVKK